jgi:Na+/glutamate symporter
VIELLLFSLLFGAAAGFLFAALLLLSLLFGAGAENHPAPSQTALIPAFFACVGLSVVFSTATAIVYLVGLIR